MTGRYASPASTLNMAAGSTALSQATCGTSAQGCCDSTFGKMIGGLSKKSNLYFNFISLFHCINNY